MEVEQKFLSLRGTGVSLSFEGRFELPRRNVKIMSNIIPVTTDDERDPREDQAELDRREAEIKGDRPPHHGG
jgi:hypothetical protein